MTNEQILTNVLTIEAQAEALWITASTMRKSLTAPPKKKKGLSPNELAKLDSNFRKYINKKTALPLKS